MTMRLAHSTLGVAVAAIFRRKQIYEALHPETKAEANASTGRKTSDNLSFVSATAQTVGKDERTVRRAAARGEALGDDLAAVAYATANVLVAAMRLARAYVAARLAWLALIALRYWPG